MFLFFSHEINLHFLYPIILKGLSLTANIRLAAMCAIALHNLFKLFTSSKVHDSKHEHRCLQEEQCCHAD